ncbi:immunoglobulin-like and fibronectin type III domain-containing protein 1 [Polymixia lowei]
MTLGWIRLQVGRYALQSHSFYGPDAKYGPVLLLDTGVELEQSWASAKTIVQTDLCRIWARYDNLMRISGIRKRSKIPGVMITQFVEDLPEGKSTPDFKRKPISLTIQEGKLAVFKAMVKGDPKPEVTWRRAKGDVSDTDKFQSKYDESSGEYTLEIHKVSGEETDTYKCFAVNTYGKAVCTATLNVIEVGFKKQKAMEELDVATTDPSQFRKLLRKSKQGEIQPKKDDGEIDDRFWEIIMNADRKDYERICAEFGVKDLRLILKKLEEKKKQRVEEQSKYVDYLRNLRHIEVKGDGSAFFEFEMELKDPTSRIFLYKDGVMIPFEDETELKHSLKTIGKKLVFSIRDLVPEDAGLYQVDVEEVNVFSTEFRVSDVDFIVKIQEVKAQEREDALFECVLTHPLSKIKWMGKNSPLDHGEKYSITVSEDKLIHRLLITDCKQLDRGIYAAVAGIKSCSAWLVVEAEAAPAGKKKARKTTLAGGAGIDLDKVAKEQQVKMQEEKIEAAVKANKAAEQVIVEEPSITDGGDAGNGKGSGTEKDNSKPVTASITSEKLGSGKEGKNNNSKSDGSDVSNGSKHNSAGCVTKEEVELVDGSKSEKHAKTEQAVSPKVKGESTDPNTQSECDDTEDPSGSAMHSRRKRQGPLLQDLVIDPGVQFITGLSDVNAIIGESAEIMCKLSSDDCEGVWFRDGKKISADDDFIIAKEGATHKLLISSCKEEHSGKYRFEADGRKTEATINVKDPPRFDPDDLNEFTKPVIVKVGQNAIFKLPFVGNEPMKIQWFREGEELLDDNSIKIEKSLSQSRLLLSKCQRKDTGEIKIKIKNEHGTTEAISQLIVLDKPTSPLGPVEIVESSTTCIEFKWRPPKDDGGSPVTNYTLERQQVGRNTWKKIGEIPGVPSYRDTNLDHGRKYCYRIRAVTAEGISDIMETDDIQAGTLAFPGAPAPPRVVSASKDIINLSWTPPTDTGGSRILGYSLEKRKKGSNLWSAVGELIKEKSYAVKDIVEGIEYEFRVVAINVSGAGEFSNPSEFVFARDPKMRPGKVTDLKVTDTSYSHLSLAWTRPEDKPGVQNEATGYFVEVRQAECIEWSRCNVTPTIPTSFTVKGLKSMGMYWVRVIAANEGGESGPQELENYVLAIPSPVRPRFTDRKMKSFMVVKAGNSVRITVNFEASPRPEVIWMRDNVPLTKKVTISNSDESSQLLIPSSERCDSGIYSILVKNLAGQEVFSVEVRVTDDPKPPGPIELEENVPGTVTVIWEPSPDEKRDDHLHYTVSKLDSTKGTWSTVADRLFNNKFTVCNIMHGREYHFRVYAKNDMGVSAPSESPTWGMEKKKEKFVVNMPTKKDCDLQCAPNFIVPLKLHTAPKGYECYMSCAVKGNPKPRITWYRNNVSLNTNTNYYISNVCGVCSMLILRVGAKDTGEYSISAENALGRAECSTTLSVRE